MAPSKRFQFFLTSDIHRRKQASCTEVSSGPTTAPCHGQGSSSPGPQFTQLDKGYMSEGSCSFEATQGPWTIQLHKAGPSGATWGHPP
jgi:hypothetical protein